MPPDASIGAQNPAEPTRAQKIAALTKAGVTIPPLDNHGLAPGWEQGGAGSAADMSGITNQMGSAQDAVQSLPATLGAAGAMSPIPGGAGIGAASGSLIKDAVNSMVYGKQKSLMDSVRDALTSGAQSELFSQGGKAVYSAVGKAVLAT